MGGCTKPTGGRFLWSRLVGGRNALPHGRASLAAHYSRGQSGDGTHSLTVAPHWRPTMVAARRGTERTPSRSRLTGGPLWSWLVGGRNALPHGRASLAAHYGRGSSGDGTHSLTVAPHWRPTIVAASRGTERTLSRSRLTDGPQWSRLVGRRNALPHGRASLAAHYGRGSSGDGTHSLTVAPHSRPTMVAARRGTERTPSRSRLTGGPLWSRLVGGRERTPSRSRLTGGPLWSRPVGGRNALSHGRASLAAHYGRG